MKFTTVATVLRIQELKISISPALANYQPVMVITKVCLEFRPKIRAVTAATITQCTNTLTLCCWWERLTLVTSQIHNDYILID
jgi:hypothetical protein